MDDDIDERDWNEEEEEEEEKEEPEEVDIPLDELGEFGPIIQRIQEWNDRVREYSDSPRERSDENEEIQELVDRAKEIIRARHELDDQLMERDPNRVSTWRLEQHQHDAEKRFRHELNFKSAGLSNEMLSDLSDDCSHLVEDSQNDEYRELRKELRAQMQNLSRSERESLLQGLYASGRITDTQFHALWLEFR